MTISMTMLRGQSSRGRRACSQDYLIGPGDVLTVTVSYAPEIGGKVRVDEDGFVLIPGIPGPTKAAGSTPSGLATIVAKALREQILSASRL